MKRREFLLEVLTHNFLYLSFKDSMMIERVYVHYCLLMLQWKLPVVNGVYANKQQFKMNVSVIDIKKSVQFLNSSAPFESVSKRTIQQFCRFS